MKAVWNRTILAESDQAISEDGKIYFPPDAIKKQYFQESDHHTVAPDKGTANYYHLVVERTTNENAAWYFPQPKEAARHLKDYVAFWHGVKIEK